MKTPLFFVNLNGRIIFSIALLLSLLMFDSLIVTSVSNLSLSFAEEKISTLEEIVVTATKVEEPKSDVPASVQIITKEDIKSSTAKDVGDLLAEAGIGHVHKYPGSLTVKVEIRGLTTDLFSDLKSRVLVLINGHRAGTVNLSKIPVEDVERIEIVKGPASVLYGSSAMGGVVNIITKEGKDGFKGYIGGEVGSWEYQKLMTELSGKKGPIDFYLLASNSSADNYDTRKYGEIENTSYNDQAVSARLGYKIIGDNRITLGFQHWKGWDIGSPGPRYSADPDNFSNKERNSFDVAFKTDSFSLNYYYVKDKDEYHGGMISGIGNSDISITKTDTQGAVIQKIFLLNDHRLILGGQWDRIEVESSRNTGAPYNPNSQYDTYGVFSEGRLSLMSKKLLISMGLRYDYFENKILKTTGIPSVKPREEEIDHVTARGGLVYKITDTISLKGNVGTAFRAPAPDELATDYVSSWGIRYLGNPDLKPEKSTSYDAGIEYSKELLKGNLTFFYTEFKDKILNYYDSLISAMTFKNVDGATIHGFETNLSYDVGLALGYNISIMPYTNITYHTKYVSNDEREISRYGKTLLYTPKWTGIFGIRAGKDNWEGNIIANYVGDEKVQDWNFTSPTFGKVVKKGDFMVVNIKGSYKPIKNLEISASIENFFDRAYEYVLDYPMPGRTFKVGVKWMF